MKAPMEEGQYVYLLDNILGWSPSDFGMEDGDFEKMVERILERAKIICIATATDEEYHEFTYYDIRFADGFELDAISGVHLQAEYDE